MLAGLTCLSGVALLLASWRRWLPLRAWAKTGGWMLIVASAALWMQASGWEFGALYALLTLPLLAWLLIVWQAERRTNAEPEPMRFALGRPGWPALARQLLLLVMAGPIAGIVSSLLCSALIALLPWQETDRLALLVLLMPVVWGLLLCWCCVDPRRWRPAMVIGLTGLCAAIVNFG